MDEAVWVFDTWGEPQGADAHEHGPDPTARTWTVNSLEQPRFDAEQRAHRVRALNASNAGYLLLEDVTWFSMGHGISGSAQTGDLLLAPGERADLLWDRETSRELNLLPYTAAGGIAFGDPMRVLDSTPAGVSPPLSFPEALPSPDPGYSDIVWVFEGDGDQLAWMINGETFPEITIPEVAFGSEPIVELRNLSAAEHPFHVHGIHFEVLSIDGVPPAHFTLADTVNLKIRQVVRLRLIADNPGDWMTH